MTEEDKILEEVTGAEYKYGFTTDVESDTIPKGLNEDVIRLISKKKEEPQWLLEHRLKAFESWKKMEEPDWANIKYKKPNYQDIIYYAAPKQKKELKSLKIMHKELMKIAKMQDSMQYTAETGGTPRIGNPHAIHQSLRSAEQGIFDYMGGIERGHYDGIIDMDRD